MYEKIKADEVLEIFPIIRTRIFGLPVCYLKAKILKYTELLF
jgi:hypothetical protein